MQRYAVTVQGIVQGVGFRPFVYTLATKLQLTGFVRNSTSAVQIEVEGEEAQLKAFLSELSSKPPPLASIARISWEERPCQGDSHFHIEASETDSGPAVFIAPDMAMCAECLAELLNHRDRRYRYPFLNCTNCGPRLTIIRKGPYDRPNTTMAAFPMCPACRAEYENPADRRFHAQPIACPACGPRLELRMADGQPVATADPLSVFVQELLKGKIGALKGLGGYHLVCDARNAQAVAELRRRKHRDEKPFAIMVRDLEAARSLCEINDAECNLLQSPRRPIVLLRARPGEFIAKEVAPGNPYLGVMLPYTPLHHLLMSYADRPLIMTSGNRSDEPIAYQDADALERLAGIADVFLVNNRPIHVRCDDSVTRIVANAELPVRRSRGYAPEPIALPFECPYAILAVGGQLKATFALGRGRDAFISHYLGDLDHLEVYKAFVRDIDLYQDLFAIRPQIIAHDLHPDYQSTAYALQRGEQEGRMLVPVQHHHAHMASCMVEHGLVGPVIGVVFDGTGYGTDGNIWGGEFLVGDYGSFRREAHFRYIGMPGANKAIHQPWRMAVAHLLDAGCTMEFLSPFPVHIVTQMLQRQFNTPMTSSAGRLFDAVAAMIGLRGVISYEGHAAIELEWLAMQSTANGYYSFAIEPANTQSDKPLIVDTRPLIRAVHADLSDGVPPRDIARRFHQSIVEIIVEVCRRLRSLWHIHDVVLSGGVFLNVVLTCEVIRRLGEEGFHVYSHQRVPPGDGGICLGQLAVACHRSFAVKGSSSNIQPLSPEISTSKASSPETFLGSDEGKLPYKL